MVGLEKTNAILKMKQSPKFRIFDPTFGSDFEMPAVDSNGVPRSVIGKIGGSKEHPESIGRGCFKQEDNVMAEFNIPPCTDRQLWSNYINYCIERGNEILNPYGLHLVSEASFSYPKEELQHPSALRFGCDPSFDALNKGVTEAPCLEEMTNPNLRSAGFHVHIGFISTPDNNCTIDDIIRLIRLCSIYLGVYSLVHDEDTKRREIYGAPGDFRFKRKPLFPQKEGREQIIVEYRALSSKMLERKNTVFALLNRIVELFNEGADLEEGDVDKVIDLFKTPVNKGIRYFYDKYNILKALQLKIQEDEPIAVI